MKTTTKKPSTKRKTEALNKHNVSSSADRTKPITLNQLISIFTKLKLKMNNGEYEVEFWLDDEQLELKSIGHFNVIPNTTITLKRP